MRRPGSETPIGASGMLVRAECVRQRNEVAIKLGIIPLSLFLSLPPSAQNHRRGSRRILKFCMGS